MVRRFSTKRRKILDLNCSLERPKCYVQCYLSSSPRHLVLEFVSMHFLVPIRRLTPSRRGVSATECRQLKPLSNQIRSLAFTRGLPRQVKGAGLRTLSRRGSWVQIPPPAPIYRYKMKTNIQCLKSQALVRNDIYHNISNLRGCDMNEN